MDYGIFIEIIEPVLGHPLNEEQKAVVLHENGPLWVVAGPGSGKTEVLVIRTLKLIFVNKVDPKSIIITTFTKKAAKNLFDRILRYANHIFTRFPDLHQEINLHSLRVGTLHSLCSDIMLESKTPAYENYRLLDDNEQYLYVYEHSDLAKDGPKYISIWEKFDFLFQGFDAITERRGWGNREYPPNKWRRTDATVSIFNRIVEDLVDINKMKNADEHWKLLGEAYEQYTASLESHHRCDFAHLQLKFLDFLNSRLGETFLNGDESAIHPGIKYVMVDEYQDTNPIQEKIYFKLAEGNSNLCIVGDDDQALYRFRGGTVDCMVTFNEACETYLGLSGSDITPRFLNTNYRSHASIVAYYNDYINSFEVMNYRGARVANKPSLIAESSINGAYPSVAYIEGRIIPDTAQIFADFVKYLLDNSVISDPKQCALLMRTVRETPRNAGEFAEALQRVGINPYNPRSRTLLSQEEVVILLGAFISIIDPELTALGEIRGAGIRTLIEGWVQNYQDNIGSFPELADYVSKSIMSIQSSELNKWLDVSILEIFYRILAHEPFLTWADDPERSYRLGKISSILETYSAIPYGSSSVTRGNLKSSSTKPGEISLSWRRRFYYSLTGLLASKGLNDPEDESIICPPGRLPIMTVHQAKGLEFPFVFVYGLNRSQNIDPSILLESILFEFSPRTSIRSFNDDDRAKQDLIRFFYVAYSRPEYALIHLASTSQLKTGFGFLNNQAKIFKQHVQRIRRDN